MLIFTICLKKIGYAYWKSQLAYLKFCLFSEKKPENVWTIIKINFLEISKSFFWIFFFSLTFSYEHLQFFILTQLSCLDPNKKMLLNNFLIISCFYQIKILQSEFCTRRNEGRIPSASHKLVKANPQKMIFISFYVYCIYLFLFILCLFLLFLFIYFIFISWQLDIMKSFYVWWKMLVSAGLKGCVTWSYICWNFFYVWYTWYV